MEKLNSKRFLFLLSIPFLACVITYIADIILNYYAIGEIEKDCIIKFILIIFIATKIVLITSDMSNLKELGAYTPHWIWAIIFPVYLFLRQHKNSLGLSYFAYYWIMTFIMPNFLNYIIKII